MSDTPRFKTLDDLDMEGRRVLLRADLNVPVKDGRVTDATRITRLVPTLEALRGRGARVVLMSHFGRPKGKVVPEMSLEPLIGPLSDALGGAPVAFAGDCIGQAAEAAVARLGPGEVVLLENLRFHAGEEANDADFAAALAVLGELYVNDAFSAAHRAHASVEALARLLPAAAGRLMQAELEHLAQCLDDPRRPLAAVVGGAKVSTKLDLLGNLVQRVDLLVIGGGMANTFLNALGVGVGRSLCEHDLAETARAIVEKAKAAGCDIVLPTDARVAGDLAPGQEEQIVSIKAVPEDAMILDIGPASAEHLMRRLGECCTLVWNGPLGCFETPPFDRGTTVVARAAAELTEQGKLLSVAGGGDTVAALAQAGALERFSYVSTAGGAFLEWLEGKTLPGVAALEAAN
ncbi:MAG: phosphoglycerate kinase [Kiloniellales bacterium]|nr:phosphoglycerate kinase [Kiloniellales bacterium]